MSASQSNPTEENYAANATFYDQFLRTPLGTLEKQLFAYCIVDCSNQTVLDLGGGTGMRARDALHAGAAAVDVVDISQDMMKLGQEDFERDKVIGHNRVHWYHGDASKPLDNLLQGRVYDLVIANGVFDHAHSAAELETMWANAAAYLKPGGRVVANRNNSLSAAAKDGKYGVAFSDFEQFPGGFTYHYRTPGTTPPLDFESVALDGYYDGKMEVPRKFFEGFETVPWEETEVVKGDREFWVEYLEDPILWIFSARKKAV